MSIYWDKRRKEEELEAHNKDIVPKGGEITRESEKSDCTDVVNIENQS